MGNLLRSKLEPQTCLLACLILYNSVNRTFLLRFLYDLLDVVQTILVCFSIAGQHYREKTYVIRLR